MNVIRLLKRFKYAFRGLITIFRTQQNFRIQVIVALAVVALGFIVELRNAHWIVIIFLILLVLLLEMLNTVFEFLVDMLKPRIHQYARDIKNMMAGMVLITAISAIIVGLLVFIPYFL
mgnify:CR=1 FL=1